MDDEDDYQSGCRMCKKLSALLPSIVAWGLLLGCTLAFYLIMAPALALPDRWGKIALVVVGVDGVLFLLVLSNLVMAMCIDPGIHPMATFSEEQAGSEDFRSPLYKNVVINGISVRMKWCVTCKFYRPPRASHCSVCNRCIDNFDHHCPWVHNCVGWRNYRYFFFFLLALSAHMIYVCVVCLIFVFNRQSTFLEDFSAVDPPFLCGCVLILMTVLLSIPVVGLTIFHLVLVLRGRSTNEQVTDQFPERRVYDEVTGKFQSGFNPFTRGWIYNCFFTLCHSQQPAFEGYNPRKSQGGDKAKRKKKLRTKVLVSDETSVLYVPDADGKDGHIRLKQLRGSDSDSVGTALSLARQPSLGNATALPPTANGSTCNLYEDRGSMRVVSPDTTAYEASLAEAMAGSALSPSVSSERVTLLNGDRRGKPLAFTDALRIHDQLNSPVKAVNL